MAISFLALIQLGLMIVSKIIVGIVSFKVRVRMI